MKKCPNCNSLFKSRYNTCSQQCKLDLQQSLKIISYNQNPNHCKECSKIIPIEKKTNKFCNSSCSASFTNRTSKGSHNARLKRISKYLENPTKCKKCNSIIPYDKKSQIFCSSLCSGKVSNQLQMNNTPVGPKSILYNCSCKVCNKKLLLQSPKHFCEECKINHSNLRMRYAFKFNVYHYPNLYDLELLKNIGWYAPRGKSGKWNPNGLSRDHKVSVAEAIKNNYDPYYITHQLNCELMPHSINNTKNSDSSLSYSSLIKLVDEYDNNNQ